MSSPDEQPDELVLPLRKALTLGEKSWTEIVLREPTGDEMREIRKRSPVDQQIAGIALVSGIPEKIIGQAPISVLEKGEDFLVGFTSAGRRTGGA